MKSIIKKIQKKAEKNSLEKNKETIKKTWLLLKRTLGIASESAIFCAKIDTEKKEYQRLFFFDKKEKKIVDTNSLLFSTITSMNILPSGSNLDEIIKFAEISIIEKYPSHYDILWDVTYFFVDIENNTMGVICILKNLEYKIINETKFI